jgi:hypothetical protein
VRQDAAGGGDQGDGAQAGASVIHVLKSGAPFDAARAFGTHAQVFRTDV